MLWNWNTIDTCFIAKSWHIRSSGMFAGSCIGVVLLVMLLEFLRRAGKEYDAFLVRKHSSKVATVAGNSLSARDDIAPSASPGTVSKSGSSSPDVQTTKDVNGHPQCQYRPVAGAVSNKYRPTLVEQLVRALLHVMQFTVAYFVMLLAMYYNG